MFSLICVYEFQLGGGNTKEPPGIFYGKSSLFLGNHLPSKVARAFCIPTSDWESLLVHVLTGTRCCHGFGFGPFHWMYSGVSLSFLIPWLQCVEYLCPFAICEYSSMRCLLGFLPTFFKIFFHFFKSLLNLLQYSFCFLFWIFMASRHVRS